MESHYIPVPSVVYGSLDSSDSDSTCGHLRKVRNEFLVQIFSAYDKYLRIAQLVERLTVVVILSSVGP